MKFTITNNTAYSADEIYWAIIGQNSAGYFCHMDAEGNLQPNKTSDNTITIGSPPNNTYADYFFKLQDSPPPAFSEEVQSGRLYLSIGDYLPIRVISDTDGAYAPPSPTNPSVPGYNTIYDKFEFSFIPTDTTRLNCNTTSVDFMGIPITASLKSGGTVGYSSNRSAIISAFEDCVNAKFKSLIIPNPANQSPLRILSPEHAMNTVLPPDVTAYFNAFFDEYIEASWNYYNDTNGKTAVLTIYGVEYDGQTNSGGEFVFKTGGQVVSVIPRKPTTMEVLNCNGVLASGNDTDKNIQKFIAAAMNRTIFTEHTTSDEWCSQTGQYYTNSPIEYYAKLLHQNSINNLCYAFGYDDVCDQSTLLKSGDADEEVTLTLPAWS